MMREKAGEKLFRKSFSPVPPFQKLLKKGKIGEMLGAWQPIFICGTKFSEKGVYKCGNVWYNIDAKPTEYHSKSYFSVDMG